MTVFAPAFCFLFGLLVFVAWDSPSLCGILESGKSPTQFEAGKRPLEVPKIGDRAMDKSNQTQL